MNTTLLVLAAGMGSRYGGTKQLDSFGPSGETIIDYSIYDAIEAGFSKVVFVIRKNIESEFKETLLKKFSNRIEVDYVFQNLHDLPGGRKAPEGREKPWGTGHAVLSAASKINSSFAIINADDFYGRKSFGIIREYLSSVNPSVPGACLVGFLLSQTLSEHGSVSRGICKLREDNSLLDIKEMTKISRIGDAIRNESAEGLTELTGREMTSMNMIGFTPATFPLMQEYFEEFILQNEKDQKAEFYIPVVLEKMIKAGISIPVLPSDELWVGVTYQEDKESTRKHIKTLVDKNVYPENLWA